MRATCSRRRRNGQQPLFPRVIIVDVRLPGLERLVRLGDQPLGQFRVTNLTKQGVVVTAATKGFSRDANIRREMQTLLWHEADFLFLLAGKVKYFPPLRTDLLMQLKNAAGWGVDKALILYMLKYKPIAALDPKVYSKK